MIALENPVQFFSDLVTRIDGKRERHDHVDFALETTEAVFRVTSSEAAITYKTDFSYFFGLQITAYRKLRESGVEQIVVSPFGDKIRMTQQSVFFSRPGKEIVIADGEIGVQQYFFGMLPVLKEVHGFLGKRNLVSKRIPEFIKDIESLFHRRP